MMFGDAQCVINDEKLLIVVNHAACVFQADSKNTIEQSLDTLPVYFELVYWKSADCIRNCDQ